MTKVLILVLLITSQILCQQYSGNYVAGLKNPERGFYSSKYDSILTVGLLNNVQETVVHRYYYIKDFTNSPLTQTVLTNIETDMQNIIATGKKIVPRFAYTDQYEGWDASLAVIKGHIDQVAPILNKYQHVIMTLQAGFIGPWGEWHNSKNNVDKKQFLDYLLMKFQGSVSIRYPKDKMQFANGNSRVSYHNDCFLYNKNDRGTFTDANYVAETNYFKQDSNDRVVGGETCGVSDWARAQCGVALSELSAYHWTYLNAGYSSDNIQQLKNGGCWDSIRDRLGYQIFLRSSTLSHSVYDVNSNQDVTFNFNIENTGFAAPIRDRSMILVLTYSGVNSAEIQLSGFTNLKRWYPGSVINLQGRIPYAEFKNRQSTLLGKTFNVKLKFPDPHGALQKPAYNIGFVNQGVYDPNNGLNDIKLTMQFTSSGGTVNNQCGSQVRYVKVSQPSNVLSLAEVQVFSGSVNVAQGKPASQSSDYDGNSYASKAVDGNTDGYWSSNSVTHTNSPTNSWWQVDLQGPFVVGKVVIYNRLDCCGERLNGATLQLIDACGAVLKSFVLNGNPSQEINLSGSSLVYKGCYRDTSTRDFPVSWGLNFEKNNCAAKAKTYGHNYIGLQYGGECFSGNTFGQYGGSVDCNMKCNADGSQICGGTWANSVYQIANNVLDYEKEDNLVEDQ